MIKNNPVLKVLLGFCPTLAVTTAVVNGVGMALAATFVLIFSNVLTAILRPFIPAKIRIPIFLIIIVTFVTTVDLLMAAFVPELHRTLGVFIPLIVVNCIILGRVEAFAYKHDLPKAFMDGVMVGLSYILTLIVISGIREILGNGTFLGIKVAANYTPMLIMIMPPGAFLLIALMIGAANLVKE
jgi:electron transport complex protein RnfE